MKRKTVDRLRKRLQSLARLVPRFAALFWSPCPVLFPVLRFLRSACRAVPALAAAVLALPGGCAGEGQWVNGADVSALATFERHGAVYRRAGQPEDALTLLRAQGLAGFRLRLFVAPDGQGVVTNDLRYTLKLAKRIKRAGGHLLLDIHYSDTWADPGRQLKPKAWSRLAFPDLVTQVRTYTHDVIAAFVKEGVVPDSIQLGNEITNGLLWPDGQVEFARRDEAADWTRLGELLRAAHAGLAAALPPGARPRTILHIESPHQLDRALWFCRQATAAGVPFDVIGVSYYPDWHGSLDSLRTALATLADTFQKPVMVVETAYPWKTDEHWKGRPHLDWPLTPAGQQRFLREVVETVRAVPGGRGAGVWYWQPEAVSGTDLPVWVGGSCALFDDHGNLLPAAAALAMPR